MVTVKYTSRMRVDIGREKDRVDAATIEELVARLNKRHGRAFTGWIEHCRIFINGSSIENHQGYDTALADGDEVMFILPVVGG